MGKPLLRQLFKNQLGHMHSSNQELTYLLITTGGYTEVKSINHWRMQSLLHENQYLDADQKDNILPVFRAKPTPTKK